MYKSEIEELKVEAKALFLNTLWEGEAKGVAVAEGMAPLLLTEGIDDVRRGEDEWEELEEDE